MYIIIGTMIVTIISMELYMLNKFSRLRFKFGFKPRAGGVRLLYYRHWPSEKDKECCTAMGLPEWASWLKQCTNTPNSRSGSKMREQNVHV